MTRIFIKTKTDCTEFIIYLEYMTPMLTKIQSVCCSECPGFLSTSDWQLVQTRWVWVSKRHTTHIRINDRPTLGLLPTRVPHNNGSPTPQDVSGDSSMDPSMNPSSSRARGTEQKYINKGFFLLVHKVIPASFCLSTKYHTTNSVAFSLISLSVSSTDLQNTCH